MIVRRNAAMLLVDCQMALRSGAWTPTRSASPFAGMATLERMLASPASDESISNAADALYDVLGQAMMAGEAAVPGYEQFELGDLTDTLFAEEVSPKAANENEAMRTAA